MTIALKAEPDTNFKTYLKMTLTKKPSFDRNEQKLLLPELPEEYLDIIIIDNSDQEIDDIIDSYSFAITDVTSESILSAKKLSNGDNVKEIYSIELSTNNTSYQPGDTIGIITKNREKDVRKLFSHLRISHLATKKCKVLEKNVTDKKNQIKPTFLNKVTTLEYIFTYCVDIQALPRKVLIRILTEHTKDEVEKQHLQMLCSKEGADDYTKEILEKNQTFLDFLLKFPTCCPPICRLIENLPKLLPRPYSIASSPLVASNKVRIVFSVVRTENDCEREGLCTGMLKNEINKSESDMNVKMYFRKSNGFNLPDENVPLILVGPGTGIAPFIGFLEHRRKQNIKGKIWMFYGCRHKDKDYLFKKELQEFLDFGVLEKLLVAFSRDSDTEAKYVQDNIKKHGKEISNLIFEENAIIYVCGDAKNMRKDTQNAFVEVFQTHKEMTNKEALECLKKLQKEKRYRQDIWL